VRYAQSTPKNPFLSLSRSRCPCARRRSSGQHCAATPGHRSDAPARRTGRQAPRTQATNLSGDLKAKRWSLLCYPRRRTNYHGGASVPATLLPLGRDESSKKHQRLTGVHAMAVVEAEGCRGGPATSTQSGRRRSEAARSRPPITGERPDQNEVSTGYRRPIRAQGYQELNYCRGNKPYPQRTSSPAEMTDIGSTRIWAAIELSCASKSSGY
jgi:hypothetical protein